MTTKVKCPVCTNKRLLDMASGDQAEIIIKCPRCQNIIRLTFRKNRIKAKVI
ncbi:hypothetical protein [Clostridium autoethanogenum]|uniref:hypothetical protein n=1 Tax=Clostridium autoethanogenum TaxID=84023 RepID=UPI001605479C|nr:hypothetical protein [Clostridium autoethanogenum]